MRHIIATDCAVEKNYAAIAGVVSGRDVMVLFMGVVMAHQSSHAEWVALKEAMTRANRNKWRNVTFKMDANLPRDCRNSRFFKRMMELNPDWRLEDDVPRNQVHAAHTLSRQVLKVYRAGLNGSVTDLMFDENYDKRETV